MSFARLPSRLKLNRSRQQSTHLPFSSTTHFPDLSPWLWGPRGVASADREPEGGEHSGDVPFLLEVAEGPEAPRGSHLQLLP